jgi:hypothetical protein
MNPYTPKSRIAAPKGWAEGTSSSNVPDAQVSGGGATKKPINSREGVRNSQLVDSGRTYKQYEKNPVPAFPTVGVNSR